MYIQFLWKYITLGLKIIFSPQLFLHTFIKMRVG